MDANGSNDTVDRQASHNATSTAAAQASTSRLDQQAASPQHPRIELLSDHDGQSGPSDSDAPLANKNVGLDKPDTVSDTSHDPSTPKQATSPASTPSKPLIFLKSLSPKIPLQIHVPPEFNSILERKIQIAVRSHGGAMARYLGKADLIVIDPKMVGPAKKALKEANQIGQPVPVVTPDYIYDSVTRGERINFNDPKYKYDGSRPQTAPAITATKDTPLASHSFGGRNPFTEADREAVIAYFIHKPDRSCSINTAAKELAKLIPSHTHSSFQTYLQNNYEKGWNLKERVLLARRAALQDEPSELHARILRSQYTASPGPAEQSAPSDGWPRTSSALSQAERATSLDEDDEDLQVRQPNPGAAIQDVEKSSTKANSIPIPYASSEQPDSRCNSVEPPPSEQRIDMPVSPPRRARRSSHSSDDSELDQLDADSDENMLTTGPIPVAPQAGRNVADGSEDSEWEGTRRAELRMRRNDASYVKEGRTRFAQEEKDELILRLADHVRSQGRVPDVFTQDAVLAKPEDSFWERFAQDNPTHTLASWRSHYLKNHVTYKQIIDHIIAEMNGASDKNQKGEEEEHFDEADESMSPEAEIEAGPTGDWQHRQYSSLDHAAVPDGETESADRKINASALTRSDMTGVFDDMSLPADGTVVMIPTQPAQDRQRPKRTKPQRQALQQWPQSPSPPLMEEEEQQDMMQVEAEIDTAADEPDGLLDEGDQVLSSSSAEVQAAQEQPAAGHESDAADKMPSTLVLPTVSTPTRPVVASPKRGVDAGTPVLEQHRDAPFYDFTMDSDEEQRIRKARSCPSLPNLPAGRQQTSASRTSHSPITSRRVLSHLATPSRNRAHTDSARQEGRGEDPIQRTRDWARRVSTTPFSASPDLFQDVGPVAVAETSRSRASRIDRRPLLRAERAPTLAPQLLQSDAKTSRAFSSPTKNSTPAHDHPNRSPESLKRLAHAEKLDREAARIKFRADVEHLRADFDLHMLTTRELLLLFRGRVKDARTWLGAMRDEYGVDAGVAYEFLKTSNGDLAQAENFLRLATKVTRSSSASRLVGGASSRSASHSVSPVKRGAGMDERSASRLDREDDRAVSAKRLRR
ncbi:uncharacterized protein UBRO2_05099 [Ustilago bromivora]|uniref:BRCT domain-containing protein n=1 Tax=Ustilago bromivora TaxID=307758 RepID=A0A8H8TUF0_9BASI|nr:uncharacterized protein UBRO2_05099 [Ustilago bromivora]